MSHYAGRIAVTGPSGQQELAVGFLVPQEDAFVDAETWAAGNEPPPPRTSPDYFRDWTSAQVTAWLDARDAALQRVVALQAEENMDYAHLDDRFDYLKTAPYPDHKEAADITRRECRACGMVLGSSASLRMHLGVFLQRPECRHLKGTGVPLVTHPSKKQKTDSPKNATTS